MPFNFQLLLYIVYATAAVLQNVDATTASSPIKVFILAGQSNMVGAGSIKHLNLLIEENENNEFRTTLWNETKYKIRDDVYIKFGSYESKLAVNRTEGNAFGPDIMFGWTIGDAIAQQTNANVPNNSPPAILLIKVAYAGMDLAIDFRPPSAGIGNYSGGIDPSQFGLIYRTMIQDAFDALDNMNTYLPNYDENIGYELVGFVWFQGWSDYLDEKKVKEYESNLRHFIRDVRSDLNAPNLPFGTSFFKIDIHYDLRLCHMQSISIR
jgi:Carbohydrate esterase, sialic acid-specific acetylesterase